METLKLDIDQGIASLTLNRPAQKNAIDPTMRNELIESIDTVRRNNTVKVLVITGAGGNFCSGGDIRSMQPSASGAESGRSRIQATHEWLEPLLSFDRPVIAAVDGVAYGGGFSLAVAADFVLATPRARFCLSFLRVGLIPDCGALYTLPRVVGLQRAKELMFSTRELGTEEARQLGIVHTVAESDELQERAQQMAAALSQASSVALSMTKRGLNMSLNSDLRTMLEFEATAQGVAMSSAPHQDAVSRFISKQAPAFSGFARKE